MDEMDDMYNNYWETSMFFDTQPLDSWDIDIEEAFSSYFNSSSPDAGPGTPSTAAAAADKNIVMERNRRKRFNDSLYSLRSLVPNITKMDKASIIKDAIGYIEELQEQERRMVAEIMGTEPSSSRGEERSPVSVITDHEEYLVRSSSSRKRIKRSDASSSSRSPGSPENPSIQVVELKVCEVGERRHVISMSCSKKSCSTVTKVSKLFESLNLKIVTANITSLSETLLATLFVEIEDMNSAQLKEKIEVSIAELDVATSPGSSVSS